MAWTAPKTWTANSILTSTDMNTHVRDNLNETAPAKATAAGRIFVSTAANAIAERVINSATVSTAEGTLSTSYVDLTTAGPAVTVTTGANCLFWLSVNCTHSLSSGQSLASVAVSGATTVAAADARALWHVGTPQQRMGVGHHFNALTAGSNTFTVKYRTSSGTGTFQDRTLVVMAL